MTGQVQYFNYNQNNWCNLVSFVNYRFTVCSAGDGAIQIVFIIIIKRKVFPRHDVNRTGGEEDHKGRTPYHPMSIGC